MSRLEEIKELITEANELSDKIADSNSHPLAWEDKIHDNLAYLFSECHIDWLIEQAERYEKLRVKWNNRVDDRNEIVEERNELVLKVQKYEKALKEIERWDKMLYSSRELGNFAKKALGYPIIPLQDNEQSAENK